MQQRVVIAMALAKDPTLLILDEPTTGLDATVEAEVLDLVDALRHEFGASVLFISHNLAVIAKMCEHVGVLYAGRLVEEGPAQRVFEDPRHPYTVGLLRCIPRAGLRKDRDRLDTIPGFLPGLGAPFPAASSSTAAVSPRRSAVRKSRPSIQLAMARRAAAISGSARTRCRARLHPMPASRASRPTGLPSCSGAKRRRMRKTFKQEGVEIRALEDISFAIRQGETLGLVGESGSGKTTLARLLLGLRARYRLGRRAGRQAARAGEHRRPRRAGAAIQIVFQNPDAAFNRRFSARRIIARPARRAARD